jgi:GPH family glycoside/pentoside/hexuronide:cation symporter
VSERLSRRTKLSWGISALGGEALHQSRNAWLLYFYTSTAVSRDHARLSIVLVSVLLFAGKFLESVVDPLIGHWSDRTSTRFGRRIPFILAATPPAAFMAALTFMPPGGAGRLGTALYFFIVLEVFFIFASLSNLPFQALMPELARSNEERISLSAWGVYFGVGGAAVGLIGSGLLIGVFGYAVMGIAVALLALVTRLVGVAGVWRQVDRHPPAESLPFAQTLRQTAANRPFVTFMVSFIMFMTALTMVIALLPFYVTNVLRASNTGLWSSILITGTILAMVAGIPLFARLGRRTSKERAYGRAMIFSACTFPILVVAGTLPGTPHAAQAVVAMVIIGVPLAGVYLFPGPIIADFCDADSQTLGVRREGVFYSIPGIIDKLIEAFGPLLLGLILLLGHRPDDLLGIRLVGPVAGLLVITGYVIFRLNQGKTPDVR